MPLQWRNQFWQSLEEGAGKRCWECDRFLNLPFWCGAVRVKPEVEPAMRSRARCPRALFHVISCASKDQWRVTKGQPAVTPVVPC